MAENTAQRTTRTRDVHWRLDPKVVQALQERAFQANVSVALLVNSVLDRVLEDWGKENNEN